METFEITSGKMKVTDPCYDMDTWCAKELNNVKNGVWHAKHEVLDGRVAVLMVLHESVITLNEKKFKWRLRSSEIGVDSGQAGFFDFDRLKTIKSSEVSDKEFYSNVCELTNPMGTLEFGVASSTGYGDGTYPLYAWTLNGEIVAAKIVYMKE